MDAGGEVLPFVSCVGVAEDAEKLEVARLEGADIVAAVVGELEASVLEADVRAVAVGAVEEALGVLGVGGEPEPEKDDRREREGREPNLNSPNGREVRLADALAFLRKLSREKRAAMTGADEGQVDA